MPEISQFANRLNSLKNWTPPRNWLQITCIDAHAQGEPLRVIVDGYPQLQGATILAQRRYAQKNLDYLRTALMWEPRGHADMYGCLVTPPVSPEADFGVLFLHNAGYSTMCGHTIIAITKVVLETGMFEMIEPETNLKIDTPAGLVSAYAKIADGRVKGAFFHNVPSFVLGLDETVEVHGLGKVKFDLAFGGAFYAYVRAEDVGVECTPENFRALIESIIASNFIGRAVKTIQFGPHPAIIPEVEGTAHISGINTFVIDPNDPLRHGFILR